MRPRTSATVAAFESARDQSLAAGMAAYMKHHFPFLGVAAPQRRVAQASAWVELATPRSADELLADAYDLWSRDAREFQYAANDLLARHHKLLTAEHLDDVRTLITTKSWWDTVDTLCCHVAGSIVHRHPEQRATMGMWLVDDDFWLNRSAILHMERRQHTADFTWLTAACLRHGASREFFIRKAIGWALRSYARRGPEHGAEVVEFVARNESVLSGLSKREALKHLGG